MAVLRSNLSVLADATEEIAAEGLKDIAAIILPLVKIFAPVDTGALRDSYRTEQEAPLRIAIGSDIDYSVYQEYGTYKMAAQPHLLPAFHIGEKEAPKLMRARIEQGINDASR